MREFENFKLPEPYSLTKAWFGKTMKGRAQRSTTSLISLQELEN